MLDMGFYKKKKIFVTGHTGFKGSWLCKILQLSGAQLSGYALDPPTDPSLFELAKIGSGMDSHIGDIRDLENLSGLINKIQPDIIIHLAAQPIVRESYVNPVYTYETNVMGTVNILEAVRKTNSVRSFVNVTTDKVYKNREWLWGYREDEELNGYDPYSNSKSCSELVTESFRNSFLANAQVAVSTARAGNVIGGGDFAKDRIIPDCIRAMENNRPIVIRNPSSIRPYQHVLEPVVAYLVLAQKQYNEPASYAGSYNIGPDEIDCVSTGRLADLFIEKWGSGEAAYNSDPLAPHEASFLKLDNSKMKSTFNWQPKWHIETAVEKTIEWTKCWLDGSDAAKCMAMQIEGYLEE